MYALPTRTRIVELDGRELWHEVELENSCVECWKTGGVVRSGSPGAKIGVICRPVRAAKFMAVVPDPRHPCCTADRPGASGSNQSRGQFRSEAKDCRARAEGSGRSRAACMGDIRDDDPAPDKCVRKVCQRASWLRSLTTSLPIGVGVGEGSAFPGVVSGSGSGVGRAASVCSGRVDPRSPAASMPPVVSHPGVNCPGRLLPCTPADN